MRKHTTLLFLQRENELLLAMKKRGFGVGKWNGVGGKFEPGETPLDAAIRECQEEIGVTPTELQKVCELDFYFSYDSDFNHYTHVFIADEWEGEPHETDEMRPAWFKINEVPYAQMWKDDKTWLPLVLRGKRFRSSITLDENERITNSTIAFLNSEEDF
jgi:8-oxo-dGTP diphosphatase